MSEVPLYSVLCHPLAQVARTGQVPPYVLLMLTDGPKLGIFVMGESPL